MEAIIPFLAVGGLMSVFVALAFRSELAKSVGSTQHAGPTSSFAGVGFVTTRIPERQRAMEEFGVESWDAFDLKTLYPELSDLTAARLSRGQTMYGPLEFQTDGMDATIFDWLMAFRAGRGATRCYFQTVAAFRLEDTDIPHFNLRPLSIDWQLKIRIPTYSEVVTDTSLSLTHRLESSSPYRARIMVENSFARQELVGFLSTHNWHVDRFEGYLSICEFNRIVAPNELGAFTSECRQFIQLLRESIRAADEYIDERIDSLSRQQPV